MEEVHHNGAGKVYSYTLPRLGPLNESSQSPSVFVVVQLDQGPKVLGILDGMGPHPPGVKINMPVRLAIAKTHGAQPLPHFQPR